MKAYNPSRGQGYNLSTAWDNPMAVKRCPHCGYEMPETYNRCPKCKNKVKRKGGR